MQPGGRFIEDVHRVLRPLQGTELRRDLDPLCLAAGQGRRRLPQRQITQAEIGEHLDLPAHCRLAGEERDPFLHRHVQHIVDRLAPERHLERLGVEPRALARAACHFDVRHEIELCRDHAFALALFAPAALDVEAESPRFVVALHRQRRLSEQVPDDVVEPDVGCRVRAAVPANRRLIDVDHLVHVLDAVHAVVITRQRTRVDQLFPEHLVENLVHQRALA